MTNLSDFLKVKQVRCIKGYDDCLEIGKEYSVLDIRMEVKVKDDEGDNCYWEPDYFEPVLESAENQLQDVELTPEFEAVEPRFKVGDKVYCPLANGQIKTLHLNEYHTRYPLTIVEGSIDKIDIFDERGRLFVKGMQVLYHATQENYEMLSKRYPHIKFEAPAKPLTGIELAKKLIAKGHNYLVVDTVIGIRVLTRLEGNTLIDSNNVRLDELDDITPLDDITGEPLTESVLDE